MHTATLVSNEKITTNIHSLVLEFSDDLIFRFTPGQFINIHIPANKPIYRSYSIASSASNNKSITLLIKLIEDGAGSRYISSLKVGDRVQLLGPAGVFAFKFERDYHTIFICTGTGVSPFYPMILHALEQGFQKQIDLYFGVASEADLFYLKEFQDIADSYQNFHFHPSLSRPVDGWSGLRGRVTDVISQQITDFSSKDFYICGLPQMVVDVQSLLQNEGVPLEHIFSEKY